MERLRKIVHRFSCASAQREDDGQANKSSGGSKKKKASKKPFTELDSKKPETVEETPNRCGLAVRQAFLLKQSWKGVMRNEEFGVDMFIRLFKTNSELKTMFHNFKDMGTDDELRSNEALEFHATMVMSTLDDAITHIDNYEFVQQLLTKTGGSHQRFSAFKPETFLNIKQPFLDAVQVTLGDRYTENMERIYKIAITFIIDSLMKGLQDEIDKHKEITSTPSS